MCSMLIRDGLLREHVACVAFSGRFVRAAEVQHDHVHSDTLSAWSADPTGDVSMRFSQDVNFDGTPRPNCQRLYFAAPDALVQVMIKYPITATKRRYKKDPDADTMAQAAQD